jgi:hypothetical protein
MGGAEARSVTRLGLLAVGQGMVLRNDLARCLRRQVRLKQAGIRLRLGQVLVKEDLISTSQLVRLLGVQRRLRASSP